VALSVVDLSRLELHADNNKPELVFMEQVEEVSTELQQVTNFNTEAAIDVQLELGLVLSLSLFKGTGSPDGLRYC
jgi:hypothetical protein